MSNIKKIRLYKRTLYFALIFLVLLILNIIFLASLVKYYYFVGYFKFSLASLDNIITILAAIIILGFISTRLPKLRNMGDSSFYEIAYLIVIGLLSIIISYFNKSTNSEALVAPFLDVFEILSVSLILMLIMSKTKFFKKLMFRKANKKDFIVCMVMFSVIAIIASCYFVFINNSQVNVRNLIVMIAGLFGGPIVGIPAGIISGGFRLLQEGVTAVPCALATVICGFLSSTVYIINGRKLIRRSWAVILMFLFIGFEMLLIIWLTPENISIPYVQTLYPLMLFGNVLGMILFLMIAREEKNKDIDYEELRINELENTVEEYQDKVDRLEEDIELLKKKNNLK